MPDFIDLFLEYTANVPSPEIFRLWSGVASVACALERRVWLESSAGKLYPNLYVMLVAPPAVGKGQAIDTAVELWRGTKKLFVAPDSMTKASLLDRLAKSGRKIPIRDGKGLFEYHSLALGIEEFGTLVPAHDMEFLSFLIKLYNNPPTLAEDRRTTTSHDIIAPQLNMLVGTQPSFLAHLLPEEAWGMGFMSRMVMVYSTYGIDWDEFDSKPKDENIKLALIKLLIAMANVIGGATANSDYIDAFRAWRKAGFPPINPHHRLEHYNKRRGALAHKLAMISAVAKNPTEPPMMTADDLQRAQGWMFPAELRMPDIFREMAHKSDAEVINELHLFVWRSFQKANKPISEGMLYDFMRTKAPSERIPKIIEIAEKSGMLIRHAGTYPSYSPGANKGMMQAT